MPLIISEVKPGSPFEVEGVPVGSVFLRINEKPLFKNEDIEVAKNAALESNNPLTATVFSNGQSKTFEIQGGSFGILVTDMPLSEMQEQFSRDDYISIRKQIDHLKLAVDLGVNPDKLQNIVLTTTPEVPNRRIAEVIDVITAESVFGVNLLQDLFSGLRDIVGGRAKGQQSILREARKVCLEELRMDAASIGADAVVGIDLDYSEISGGNKSMLILVASGTAVRLED